MQGFTVASITQLKTAFADVANKGGAGGRRPLVTGVAASSSVAGGQAAAFGFRVSEGFLGRSGYYRTSCAGSSVSGQAPHTVNY